MLKTRIRHDMLQTPNLRGRYPPNSNSGKIKYEFNKKENHTLTSNSGKLIYELSQKKDRALELYSGKITHGRISRKI